MGYRSEVGLVVTSGLNKQLIANNHAKEVLDMADISNTDEESECYLYLWDSIKWCDEYDNIKALETIIHEEEEEHHFIRIGEENDDIEISGQFWTNPFSMSLRKEIVWNDFTTNVASVPNEDMLKALNSKNETTKCVACHSKLTVPYPGIKFCKNCE
jgi:hypothetical protein